MPRPSGTPANLESLVELLALEPGSRQRRQLLQAGREWWKPETVARRLHLATGSIGFIRGRCLQRLRKILDGKGF